MLVWLIYLFLIFLIGLCIGSFLNVVILRSFSGESIVLPPSKCPKCHKNIKWYDNIPVLSYLILRGKCRFCGEKISIQYPLVELLTGFLFVFISMHNSLLPYGISITAVFLLVIASLSVVIAVTDIKEKVVFDVHTITFIVVALIFHLVTGDIVTSIIGLVSGALIMEILARAGYLMVNKRAFGVGDTYIAAGIGALVGFKYFILVLILSLVIQVLFVLPSFVKKLALNREYKLLSFFFLFLSITFIYKVLAFNIDLNPWIELGFVAVILVTGIYSCIMLIKSAKLNDTFTYFPFGPSLLIAMFFVVFWGSAILEKLKLLQ